MQGPQVDRENVRIKIALIKEIEKLSKLCDEVCKWRKKDGVEFLRVGSSADRYGRMEEEKNKKKTARGDVKMAITLMMVMLQPLCASADLTFGPS